MNQLRTKIHKLSKKKEDFSEVMEKIIKNFAFIDQKSEE